MGALRLRRRADALLLVTDVGCAVLAAWLAFVLRFEGDRVPTHYLDRYRIATVIAAASFVLGGRLTGLYRRAALRLGNSNLRPALQAGLGVGALLLIANYTGLSGDLS